MGSTAKKARLIPTRLTSEQVERIDRLVKRLGLRSRSEFVREAVERHIEEVGSMRIIEIRDIGIEQAKKEIVEYLKGRAEADSFDIANDLRLDMDLTVKALKELWEEGEVG